MTPAEAVPVLTRLLRDLPTPVLRRMAESDSPTTAAVARAILDTRPLQPRDRIFPS